MRWALRPRSHLDWITSRQGSHSLLRPRACQPTVTGRTEAGIGLPISAIRAGGRNGWF